MRALGEFTVWVIYDRPLDFPESYVAREFILDRPTSKMMTCQDLKMLRDVLSSAGLICLTLQPKNDPKILEVWL